MRLFLASTSFYHTFFSLKTYSTGYFRKQQNETGYFCGMTLFQKTEKLKLNGLSNDSIRCSYSCVFQEYKIR